MKITRTDPAVKALEGLSNNKLMSVRERIGWYKLSFSASLALRKRERAYKDLLTKKRTTTLSIRFLGREYFLSVGSDSDPDAVLKPGVAERYQAEVEREVSKMFESTASASR